MKSMETKDLSVKFTMPEDGADDKGAFKGYASIFDAVDSYGDVVMRGAFRKTLSDKKQFPLLWSHDISRPIGVISAKEDKTGLKVEGQLNLDVQLAREIRSLMKQGAVRGLSIGYQTVKDEQDTDRKARLLREINLWEISPVVFQACPDALVADVKSMEPVEGKPYPNEHSCRLADPDTFSDFRRTTRKHEGKEYSVIFGKKDDGSWEEQAYRYPKDAWDADEARSHCNDHDGTFEAASGKAADCVECSALQDAEPDVKSTLDVEPQEISKPEDKLHLLDSLRLKF
jgi:HK97 family phage prohead protease